MQLRDLFAAHDLPLQDIAVLFHVSDRPKLHGALARLADEAPDLLNVFQNHHGEQVEATLKKRRYICCFVPFKGSEYVLAGLFEITGSTFCTMAELDADPHRTTLRQLYDEVSFVELGQRTGQQARLVVALALRPEMEGLIGRLVVRKPASVRNYRFLAENPGCQIVEITRQRQLSPPPPDWRDFVVTTEELRTLPRDWLARLEGWRGVYLIMDDMDGMRYVGAAYGTENLRGRWMAHVDGMLGITVELQKRNPAGFRFSILQLLLHDADAVDVQKVETNWKLRLHTRQPFGLNLN